MDIIGKKIIAVHRGPWSARPGVDMPGIAGPTWHYCDLFLSLDDSTVISLAPSTLRILPQLPAKSEAMKLSDKDGKGCIGNKVLDILRIDDDPTVLVLLENGRYIDHSYMPGGSTMFIGSFSDWPEEDFAVEFVSMISGCKLEGKSLRKKA